MKEDTKAVEAIDEMDPVEHVKEKKTKKAEEPKSTNLYDKESYDITLPISQNEDDDVTVIVNGECTKIQRGVPVTVSAAVYEILQNSMKMDNLAYQRSKKLAEFKQLN